MKLIEIRILIPMSFVATGIHFSQGQCYAIWTKEKTHKITCISNQKDKCCLNTDVCFFLSWKITNIDFPN